MANSSIPNSSPANGRISTRSLRRSRKQDRTAARYQALASTKAITRWSLELFNAQRSTFNAQRSIQIVEGWMLDVGSWTFLFFPRRVKGAWWPSRSSKPSSPRKWRGRFDSYPLRQIIFDCRQPIADCPGTGRMISIANRNSKIENWLKGGDIYVA